MNYTNIVNALWKSEAILMQSKTVQLTFLRLTMYCTDQENGGRIRNCDSWPSTVWRDVVHVSQAEVKKPSPLWQWKEHDLIVAHYPIEQERMCRKLRKINKKKARLRWLKYELEALARLQADGDADGITGGNAKDKEKKDKGKKGKKNSPGVVGESGISGGEEGLDGENPAFPASAAEACKAAEQVGCPEAFAALTWNKARGRGGRDAQDIPVRNWPGFLATEWKFDQDRQQRHPAGPSATASVRDRIRATEQQLDDVRKKLSKILSYAPDVFPKEHAQAEKKRAPLLAEKQRLKDLLVELRQSIATQGGAA